MHAVEHAMKPWMENPRRAEINLRKLFSFPLLILGANGAQKAVQGAFTKIKNETKSGEKFTFFVPSRSWGPALCINEG